MVFWFFFWGFLLLLSVDHWTRYEFKNCTIPNMSNTHLFCVPLFGSDVSGWAFFLDEREWASSTSLYFRQEISRITSVEVNYNYIESSFRFLFFPFCGYCLYSFFHSSLPFLLGLSVSLYYCMLFCFW